MKLPYSDFTYFLKPHFDNIANGGIDWCVDFCAKNKLYFVHGGKHYADQVSIETAGRVLQYAAYYQILAKSGSCDHYFFVGNEFLPWLESVGTPENGEMLDFLFSSSSRDRVSMLHFEGGKSPCLLVGVMQSKNNLGILIQDNNRGFFTFDKTIKTVAPESAPSLHLVFNALSYIKAFPDTVLPGLPDTVKHAPRYRNAKCFGVVPSKEIIERDGPKPHYRTGHFRFLQSERFKHKRGMTIFIKGTFVKGRAMTVLSPEETTT
jgi:hypothetical protein